MFSTKLFLESYESFIENTHGSANYLKKIQTTFLDLCLKKIRKDTSEIKTLYEKSKSDGNSEVLTHLLPWSNQERINIKHSQTFFTYKSILKTELWISIWEAQSFSPAGTQGDNS